MFNYVRMLWTVALAALLFWACQKEAAGVVAVDEVALSCDTVAFDTVFTQMGSTSRQLKVYNHSTSDLYISSVTLAQGRASRFRLNVDGDTNMVARNLHIAPGDSMFVFVRVNVNPNSETEPFIIEDAIVMEWKGGTKRVPLTAWGRNAVYHVPTDTIHYADGTPLMDMFGNPYAYSVIDCDNWRHDLPHVVVGYAVVDSRNTLHLTEGDELYFCNDAVLWVYDSATLDVRGTKDSPVLFTSVRHDGWYDDLPGQWGMVWLSQGSVNNVIDYAVVENGFVGLQADSNANNNATLTISNTIVRNHTLAGLLCNTAVVNGDNVLVVNCGTATVALQYGGSYVFENCTFADYWRYDARKYPSVQVSNYRDYGGIHYVWDMYARFTDCIIYGTRAEELWVDLDNHATATCVVDHCLVKGGEWDEDPLFTDVDEGDYSLQEDSPAKGIGYGGS